jgi:amino acid transporter
VVIRILLQFVLQAIGIMVLRIRRPDMPRPFRMWLYPLPALVSITGFSYILVGRKDFLKEIRYALVILVAGILLYALRAWRNRDWPFRPSLSAPAAMRAN